MIAYFRMKKKEIKLKLMIYEYLLEFIEKKENFIPVVTNLLHELANVSQEDLLNSFIEKTVILNEETNI